MSTVYEHYVKIPVVGYVTTLVESDRELSLDEVWDIAKDRDEVNAPWESDNDWLFEPVRNAQSGNFFFGDISEIEITEIAEYEDD